MANILAIETSSEACSLALSYNKKIFSFHEEMPKQHTEKLLGILEGMMKKEPIDFCELDAIAAGCGPGSFTGIRLACSVVQGLAYSSSIPAIRVSSLEIMAEHINKKHRVKDVVTLVDAHMKQLYLGRFIYDRQGLFFSKEEALEVKDFCTSNFNSDTCFVGNGCELVKSKIDKLKSKVYLHLPNALDLLSLAKKKFEKGETVSPEKLLPIYLTGEEHWVKS